MKCVVKNVKKKTKSEKKKKFERNMKSHDDFARERMKCGELTTPRKYAELFKGLLGRRFL